MKSKLSKIYNDKDKFDILNKPTYLFGYNPFYQVNKFIMDIDPKLNRNFVNNLEDLIINNSNVLDFRNDNYYDYRNNILTCGNSKADIYGLLHVASNDRNKKNTGIIFEDGIGYGLNAGLTDVFTNEINNKLFNYPLEALVARALLVINNKLVTYSYFENNAACLLDLNSNIKELMKSIDNYYSVNFELMPLKSEYFAKKFNMFKGNMWEIEMDLLDERIYNLEKFNRENVYSIFQSLISIINNSMLNREEKQELFIDLHNIFRDLFTNDKLEYLNDFPSEFEKHIYVKKKKYEKD